MTCKGVNNMFLNGFNVKNIDYDKFPFKNKGFSYCIPFYIIVSYKSIYC